MRTLFFGAVLALAIGIAGPSRAPVNAADKTDKASAPYVHAVVFYLKKDAPKDEVKEIVKDCEELLAKIPSVRSLKVGPPAEKATPKVAVTDYSVGLLVLVDDFDGLTKYLDHPDHLKFVDKHLKHVDKVLVYDFVQANK